jgi:hypothetical protein
MRPHYDEIRMTGYSLPQYSSEINAIVDRIVLWRYLPLALAGWIIGMILGPMLAQTGTSDKILVGLILWAVCMLSNWLQRTAHWQSFSGTQSGAISATVWSVFTILLMLIAIPIIIAIESSQSHGGGAYRGGMGFLHWYVLMALLQAQSPYSPHKPAKPETRIKLYRDVLPGYWPDSQSPS